MCNYHSCNFFLCFNTTCCVGQLCSRTRSIFLWLEFIKLFFQKGFATISLYMCVCVGLLLRHVNIATKPCWNSSGRKLKMLSYRRVCGGGAGRCIYKWKYEWGWNFFPPFFSLLFIMHTRVCVSRRRWILYV